MEKQASRKQSAIQSALSSVPNLKKKRQCLHPVTQSGLKYAIAWVTYVVIGSYMFLWLEQRTSVVLVEHPSWARFKELVNAGKKSDELLDLKDDIHRICPEAVQYSSSDDLFKNFSAKTTVSSTIIFENQELNDWINKVQSECEMMIEEEITEYNSGSDYSMVDAIYYTMTLVTTIGFGHIYPTTPIGQIFSILYALVGVPLTCILMAKNSEMLSNKMLRIFETAKKRRPENYKMLLYGITWLYLIVGFTVFLFLPAVAFSYFEEWTYLESLYFTFITLTTIGFGDYIAGYNLDPENYVYPKLYKMSIIIWIMIALGYWVLLLNFLTKALKSNAKHIKRHFNKQNIAKQAEFLRQLMAKVRSVPEKEDDQSPEEKLHMMAVMVERMSSRRSSTAAGFHSNKASNRRMSARTPDGNAPSNVISDSEEDSPESEESSTILKDVELSALSFDDLMKVEVVVRTEAVPGFESLVTRVTEGDDKEHPLTTKISNDNKIYNEVTLPLRDVLGVVLFAASLDEPDEEQPLLVEEEDDDDSFPSDDTRESSPSTAPLLSPKESIPMLKDIFLNSSRRKLEPRKSLTGEDREKVQSLFLKSALKGCLEELDDADDYAEPKDMLDHGKPSEKFGNSHPV